MIEDGGGEKVLDTYYVTPDGTGTGEENDPAGLQSVLDNTSIRPGTTIWLRGGTYKGDYVCNIGGDDA